MMIASVLNLTRADVKALKITDTYSLHRVVYSIFDDIRSDSQKTQSVSSGILYADKGGDFHGRKILILSNRQPNAPEHGEISIKKIAETFLDYSDYRFEVIVNPTKRDSKSRQLTPLKTREEIANWFISKAPQWGFEVSSPHLEIEGICVKRFTDKNGNHVTQGQAKVLGRLHVSDKEKFVQSFKQGVGRGRAFGAGLLQVVPL